MRVPGTRSGERRSNPPKNRKPALEAGFRFLGRGCSREGPHRPQVVIGRRPPFADTSHTVCK